MKNFRTYQLAIKFYHSTQEINLSGCLRNQLDRAASSIVLNLAEGYGRSTRKDQKRFFDIALGSLRECQAVLEITVPDNQSAKIFAEKLAAHIFCLIKALS